ncbi:MAG: histidine phosphatase family protein [Acidimicrobiales bacterium]
MTNVLLVRHGQSVWNATGRWQGQADPELSDLGRVQAASATAAIGNVDLVVASDLVRASETAEIIAEQLGIGPVVLDPDLRERDAGEWSGLTRPEIHERYPGYLPDDPQTILHGGSSDPLETAGRRPPGWEDDASLTMRALRALRRMHAASPGGAVLAVTHGGVVMALERDLGVPAGKLANLGARWVTIDDAGFWAGERVELLATDTVPVTTPDAI